MNLKVISATITFNQWKSIRTPDISIDGVPFKYEDDHGYSLNQIIVWKYPTMQKVATLTGHTYRVLYLSMSPDG